MISIGPDGRGGPVVTSSVFEVIELKFGTRELETISGSGAENLSNRKLTSQPIGFESLAPYFKHRKEISRASQS